MLNIILVLIMLLNNLCEYILVIIVKVNVYFVIIRIFYYYFNVSIKNGRIFFYD